MALSTGVGGQGLSWGLTATPMCCPEVGRACRGQQSLPSGDAKTAMNPFDDVSQSARRICSARFKGKLCTSNHSMVCAVRHDDHEVGS